MIRLILTGSQSDSLKKVAELAAAQGFELEVWGEEEGIGRAEDQTISPELLFKRAADWDGLLLLVSGPVSGRSAFLLDAAGHLEKPFFRYRQGEPPADTAAWIRQNQINQLLVEGLDADSPSAREAFRLFLSELTSRL